MKTIEIPDEAMQLEQQLMQMKQKRSKLMREQPRIPVANYAFQSLEGDVTLSDLFGENDDLIVLHNMGSSCPYCTLWADGFNGQLAHYESRAPFVLVSPDPPAMQKEFAESRGWKFRMVSDAETGFTQDLGFLMNGTDYWPGVSTFTKDADGNISRVASTFLGPGDDFCPIWHVVDLLADGAKGWEPKISYSG
jgi:predicted dithiol-disulfide oxidoreductase (DUF899 family)